MDLCLLTNNGKMQSIPSLHCRHQKCYPDIRVQSTFVAVHVDVLLDTSYSYRYRVNRKNSGRWKAYEYGNISNGGSLLFASKET